ncbi:MAG: hypothetical protein R2734_02590 [Nocardioides sp.]
MLAHASPCSTSRVRRRPVGAAWGRRTALREVADRRRGGAAVWTWQAEEARLLAVRRAAGLVEEAIRGRRFVARLWLGTPGPSAPGR